MISASFPGSDELGLPQRAARCRANGAEFGHNFRSVAFFPIEKGSGPQSGGETIGVDNWGDREGGICGKIGTRDRDSSSYILNGGMCEHIIGKKELGRCAIAAHTLGRFEGCQLKQYIVCKRKGVCHNQKVPSASPAPLLP